MNGIIKSAILVTLLLLSTQSLSQFHSDTDISHAIDEEPILSSAPVNPGTVVDANGARWSITDGPIQTADGDYWIAKTNNVFSNLITDVAFVNSSSGIISFESSSSWGAYLGLRIRNITNNFTDYQDYNYTTIGCDVEELDATITADGVIWIIAACPSPFDNSQDWRITLFNYSQQNGLRTVHNFSGGYYGLNIISHGNSVIVTTWTGGGGYKLHTYVFRSDGTTDSNYFTVDSAPDSPSRVTKDNQGNIWLCYDTNTPTRRLEIAKLSHSWNGVGEIPWVIEDQIPIPLPSTSAGADCSITSAPDGKIYVFSEAQHVLSVRETNGTWSSSMPFDGTPLARSSNYGGYLQIDSRGELWYTFHGNVQDEVFLYHRDSNQNWVGLGIDAGSLGSMGQGGGSFGTFYENNYWFGFTALPTSSGRITYVYRTFLDSDTDGVLDNDDLYPDDPTQWSDTDGDGYGDQNTGTDGDDCLTTAGTSNKSGIFGCPDTDGDGFADLIDEFLNDSTQWSDTDGDGFGDNISGNNPDTFPIDSTQWNDTDGDGYGDNREGNNGDDFPNDSSQWSDSDGDGYGSNPNGTNPDSFPFDGTQWSDSDGDGYGDNRDGNNGDDFPNDSSQWSDSDGDGYGNNLNGTNPDAFPNDGTQWNDTDGDGHGDNEFGNGGDSCIDVNGGSYIDRNGCPDQDSDGISDLNDAFPNDSSRWQDTDRDGYGDEEDAFPFDPTQHSDRDDDGFGDSDRGSNADKFPDDSSQWSDIDGDGYGDNQTGNDSDAFIADPTQWSDADGDGYGDNSFGRGADAFPNDPTQWEDQDGDGYGDNLSGNDPDPYLFDFDNDGYNDSIDPLPMLASPGDIDNDGCMDEVDAFPLDYRECSDFDGDGEGDNADTDDDNDGWTDTDEIREDTDPLDASDYPIVAFQLMIPGTTIGLDGWDMIGIFGGVPLFAWIAFGFITRNSRCRKFEKMLNDARSKKELENIALKSEYALMIRLLGPHQGIRLERLRAELDDALEGEGMPFDEDHTEVVEDEMAEVNITEKHVEFDFDEAPNAPPAAIVAEGMSDGAAPDTTTPPHINTIGIVGQDGYEWLQQGGATWYRPANSGLDWAQWIQ